MPKREVSIQRVRTSDLIAMWKVYSPFRSVAFGPGCGPAMPEVENPRALSLRYTGLSLRCPGLDKLPVWRRRLLCWFFAKRPLVVSVGPECESFFDTELTA